MKLKETNNTNRKHTIFRLFIRKKNPFFFFFALIWNVKRCIVVTLLLRKNTEMKEERNGRITVWRNRDTSVELPSLRCSRDGRFLISFGLLIEIFNLSPLVVVYIPLFLLLIYVQMYLILAVVGGESQKKKTKKKQRLCFISPTHTFDFSSLTTTHTFSFCI